MENKKCFLIVVLITLVLLLAHLFPKYTCKENIFLTPGFGVEIKSLKAVFGDEIKSLKPVFNMDEFTAAKPNRMDVLTLTPWMAPIVWDGTFDPAVVHALHPPDNLTIVLAVFVVGDYWSFLLPFMENAGKYFMPGYNVTFVVLTDRVGEKAPNVPLGGAGRTVKMMKAEKFNKWSENALRRMPRLLQILDDNELDFKPDYFFTIDVDLLFKAEVGPEILSDLVSLMHPGYFKTSRSHFPYERRKASLAYLSQTQGTFYFVGALYGGHPESVIAMLRHCWANLQDDASRGITAVWNEESHMNYYFALKRPPTLVLSPEYCWASDWALPSQVHFARVFSVAKNNAKLHGKR
uniref:globoside alpha-1,3-N-acetylgalactosaminyltransferase 1-like n=1 Tax=Myxine glutinosa TaxID=7769 RepID=UPI00358F6A44